MRARMSFRSLFLTGFAITILGLGALATAILTLQWSTQQYARRADMAQRQALLLAHIDAEAAELLLTGAATARASLDRAAGAYLASIAEETVLIDAKGEDHAYQMQEAATAQRLVGLLQRHPAALAEARRLARQIAVRENAEADEAAAQARQAERNAWRVISGIIALLIALPLGIAALLWRQLIRPLDALVRATRSIATEGAPVPLPASRLSEMRQLIDHFGDMARAVDIRVRGRTAQLEALNRRLAETDQRRRLFLSKVSHELRTPMTVMRGEAEVALRLNSDAAGLRDALHQILDSNLFLERRLNDLLTLARAEDGALPLRVDRVDLADLARQAGQTAAAFAMASGVRLELADLEQAMPVMGDPDRLRQAILALIDNGVKFSPPGGRLRLSGDRGRGQMGVMIADEGPGVADGDLDRIFDPYVQGDAGRSLGGTGLGLSLARWIAQAHRGTIKARNGTEGEGLCVSLRLPALM